MKHMENDKIKVILCFFFFYFGVIFFSDICFSQTVIAFGDSLTEGCGEPDLVYWGECGWENRSYTYPMWLETIFADENQEVTVNNFGRGGETTIDAVSRLTEVLNQPCNAAVDYVLLLHGTNDLFHHTDPGVVYFNLGAMIDIVRAKGKEPLLATITPDPDHPWKEIETTNSYIRSLASEKGVSLVDLYSELAPYWYWYTHPAGCYLDQLHPNTHGFYAIAGLWHKSLSEMIKKPSMPWLMLLLKPPLK